MAQETNRTITLWHECRKRLLIWLFITAALAIILMPFSNSLFNLFAKPLLKNLLSNQPLIATGIVSGFWIPIELSLWLALLASIPVMFWQIWQFIKPALKKQELRFGKIYLGGSLLLFWLGMSFCYFVALPICLHFLMHATPSTVKVMPDIVNYLNFSFRLLLCFGIASQLPLLILLVCQLKFVTPQQLKQKHRYIIIAAFFIGMIIAPDVISQCFLAIPLWLLFELGILLSQTLL